MGLQRWVPGGKSPIQQVSSNSGWLYAVQRTKSLQTISYVILHHTHLCTRAPSTAQFITPTRSHAYRRILLLEVY